jgi:uncharacterized membrane protein
MRKEPLYELLSKLRRAPRRQRICVSHLRSRQVYPDGCCPSGYRRFRTGAKLAAALAYLAGFVTGIIFLLIEPLKADRLVRFHAFQSIFFNVAWIGFWIVWAIAGMILSAITKGLFLIVELPVNLLLMVSGFCLWIFLMHKAYQGKTFKLPIIGSLATKQASLS